MDSAQVRRVLEIVGYALEKDECDLESYLDAACGDDADLRREVLSYLEYDDPHREIFISSASSDEAMPQIPDLATLETRYDLGEEIARGGMGVVLRAYDNNLRRDVAVKVLKTGSEERPDVVRRFLQEAQIGGQLQHPGIAPVYEIGRLPDGRPFIAMKLVKGKTLATLLGERSEVTENQSKLLGVLTQVCQAIAFAQTRRVIHRDHKPENVMVGEFGEVQVMDWGLAKILDQRQIPVDKDASQASEFCVDSGEKETHASKVCTDSEDRRTRLGHVMGTPAYMAPEQSLGVCDEKTDVFALGSILCEILTGVPPGGDLDAAKQRLDDCPSDQEWIELARDCLAVNPALRPADAGVVAARVSAHLNAIESRLREAEIAAARAKVKAEEERKLRRRTHRTIAVVTALLVVFSLVGWFIRNSVHKQQSRDRAIGLVNQLLNADIARVPSIVEQIETYRLWADPLLESKFGSAADGSSEKLHLALALLPRTEKIDYLGGELLDCGLTQIPVLREALLPHKNAITDRLWRIAGDDHHDGAQRFQAAAALAAYDPDDKRWQDVAPLVAEYLTSRVAVVYEDNWLALFQPASGQLTDPLADIHADRSRSKETRARAAVALAGYLRDDPLKLADIILVADEFAEFSVLIESLKPHAASVKEQLVAETQSPMPDNPLVDQRDAHWKRQSMAAVTLVHLGHSEQVWHLLQLSPDPSLRSFIIQHLGQLNADHNTLAARLETETEVSIRRALIQGLGGLDSAQIPLTDRKQIAEQLKELYVHDHDPGVHGAALWTLRQWGAKLPELPVGEPVLSEEQEQQIAGLDAEVEDIKQRIAACEQEELPVRQVAWEQRLREQTATLPAALSEGLAAHYPLDEVAGVETANSVDGQAGGTYQGSAEPVLIPGVVGNALRLGGTGGYIDCGQAFQPERTDPFSFGCWFLLDADSPRGVLFGKFDNAARRGFAVNIDLASSHVLCEWSHRYPASTLIVTAKANELAGRWHHLVVTYDGSSSADGVQIYLDEQSIATSITADRLLDTIQTSLSAKIGRRDSSFSFRGNIDDVRIYDRALSPKKVSQLYESGVRTLVEIPTEQRTSDLKALLAAVYRPLDEPLERLEHQLAASEAALQDAHRSATRRWYVNSQGQTMAVIENMPKDGDRGISYSFAICDHEVTFAEYRRFRENRSLPSDAHEINCPVNAINWYTAAEYCNGLSERDGIPEDQWIYEPNADGAYWEGMRIKDNFLELTGYRLPTRAEWVHACSAETNTTYSFGEPVELMNRYGVNATNSSSRSQPVQSLLPNDAGLFDVHGNVQEWTMDAASGPLSPVTHAVYRMVQSPEYTRPPEQLKTKTSYGIPPQYTSYVIGFRPARTYRLPYPSMDKLVDAID